MNINANIRLEVAGENALILYFDAKEQLSNINPGVDFTEGSSEATSTIKPEVKPEINSEINPEISATVHLAKQLIIQHLSADIVDLIPSYASILVVFNLLEIDHHHLRNKLKRVLKDCEYQPASSGKLIELPVYYSLESGIDLAKIAQKANLTIAQVIALHQATEYQVYAIGFAPGFAYLGEVDSKIAMPRLSTPRLKVPKGAVAIADRQTAVYPAESPGGWHLIGLCPVEMFSPSSEPVMPVEVGDKVKFSAINKQEFIALGGALPTSPIA